MRTLILATALVLLVHTEAISENQLDNFRGGGGGFIGEKNRTKLGKDYYVVKDSESGKCSIEAGDYDDKPQGMVGDAPYASKKYAEAALKKSAECKGGMQ
jgi:hypothetical protein